MDLGADLANTMAQVEGGAMHYLEGPESAAALFADLRRFVVPVALGLRVRVEPSAGMRVAEVYGVPSDRVMLHEDGSATFRASTVFFDPIRRGAVVRMAPVANPDAALNTTATIRFSYRLPESGEVYQGQRRVSHRSEHSDASVDLPSRGAYLAYALVSYSELLRAGLRAWHQGHHDGAIAFIRHARHFLNFDQRVIDERQLDDERYTVDGILAAMGATK